MAGSTYLGSVVLPQGSTNEIFARDGEVVMVAWNPSPVRETMYLGDNVRQTNIWGQPLARMDEGHEQSFEIGPLPTFITGINESIIRWNQSLAFEKTQLPSVFGVPHECSLVMKNFFGQGVGGQLRIQTPDVWKTYPRSINFKLAAGEEVRQPFTITLPFDATSGRQPVKIDVEVNADRHYHFTAYRYLDVGSDQVTINVTSHLNERGELEIEQRFTNRSDREVNFKCLLFAPQRRRQLSQVIRLGQDTDLKIYRLSNGRELVGKTLWLRAEETGGERILNYRFVAEE